MIHGLLNERARDIYLVLLRDQICCVDQTVNDMASISHLLLIRILVAHCATEILHWVKSGEHRT